MGRKFQRNNYFARLRQICVFPFWAKIRKFKMAAICIVLYCVYLYSAQYLHLLQDSKRYLTNPTVQVQPQLTSN